MMIMFCTKCGNNMPDGAAFCPKCGTAANIPQAAETQPTQGVGTQAQAPAAPQPEAQAQQSAPQQPSSWQYQQAPTPNQNPAQQQPSGSWSQPQGAAPSSPSVSNSKVFRVLAYVPILFWLPLAFDPQNHDSRKFSNQGLILLILNAGISLAKFLIIDIILGNTIGNIWSLFGVYSVISVLFSIVVWVVSIFCFVCMVIGIIKAAQDEYFEIPLIGKFTLIK